MDQLILKSRIVLMLLMSLVMVSACDNDDNDIVILTEQELATRATQNSLFEIAYSELALNNAKTDKVMDFAN
jgi:predicted outer membrane protein